MDASGIYAREWSAVDRYVQLGVVGPKVISVSFPETPDADADGDHPVLDRIFEYLEGEPDDFTDIDIGLTVDSERRAIYERVRDVPYGERVHVADVVRTTPGLDPADDDVSERVRAALRENPVPIIVPGHRVVDGPCASPPPVADRLRTLEGH